MFSIRQGPVIYAVIIVLCLLLLLLVPVEVSANQAQQDNEVYDSLDEKIRNNFYEGMESLKEQKEGIEISGNLLERIIRSIANGLYRNLDEIKAGSLLVGVLSFLGGFIVFKTVKLNKGMKRYAVSVFMISIPFVLFIFVFAISLLIDIFI